jgi:hypothetical protein
MEISYYHTRWMRKMRIPRIPMPEWCFNLIPPWLDHLDEISIAQLSPSQLWKRFRRRPGMNERGKAMTNKMLTWLEWPGEDVWKERPAGDDGGPWLVGEDPCMCCIDLYYIGRVNGAFQLFANYYAYPGDPVRRDNVFVTSSDARAAAEAAYGRLIRTKDWGYILEAECYTVDKLTRDHRPGCPLPSRAAAALGCPEGEPPIRWLIDHGFLVKKGNRYALTSNAEEIGFA